MRHESEGQLVMERRQASNLTEQRPDCAIRTILFHVHDDDEVMDRLELALSVARACNARLHCLHVTPIEAYTVVDTFGGTFVNQEIVNTFHEEARKLRQRVEAELAKEDVYWDYEEITGVLVANIVQSAALCDLVITGGEGNRSRAITLCGDLLEQLRTPLLVTGENPKDFDPFAPAVIAWNGSYEAANAVRFSVPLLKMAERVQVVDFSEEKEELFPSTRLFEYLSSHGIKADLDMRPVPAGGIAAGLVDYAKKHRAGIIVLGGYSHSRAGEFLFGGVTRALLKECPVALVMAH